MWTLTKLLSSLSFKITPVVLCASSQIIKSKIPKVLFLSNNSFWALIITSIDWYVENMTFIPFLSLISSNLIIIFSISVVAGEAKSTTLIILLSPFIFFPEIFESEQIHIGYNLVSISTSFDHSWSACPKRAIEGTKNNTNPFLFVSFSAIFKEVKVFPVPQAIINLPLSFSLKYSFTEYIASFWCSLIILLCLLASLPNFPEYILDQSTSEFSSWSRDILCTFISWFSIKLFAFLDHLFVVETNILPENFLFSPSTSKSLAEVDIKVSTSDFDISLSCL